MKDFSKRMNFFTSLFVKAGVMTDDEKTKILQSIQKTNKTQSFSKKGKCNKQLF